MVLTLKRPDGSFVADFACEDMEGAKKSTRHAAGRDQRERTLRVLKGGRPRR